LRNFKDRADRFYAEFDGSCANGNTFFNGTNLVRAGWKCGFH
jgi:hypothetical protein